MWDKSVQHLMLIIIYTWIKISPIQRIAGAERFEIEYVLMNMHIMKINEINLNKRKNDIHTIDTHTYTKITYW